MDRSLSNIKESNVLEKPQKDSARLKKERIFYLSIIVIVSCAALALVIYLYVKLWIYVSEKFL